jgi:hypothetical protein
MVNGRTKGHRIRGVMTLVTVSAFTLIVVTKRAALARSLGHLGHPHWSWILLAVTFELASMGTSALMQRQLLGSGGRLVSHRPMMATILAANAHGRLGAFRDDGPELPSGLALDDVALVSSRAAVTPHPRWRQGIQATHCSGRSRRSTAGSEELMRIVRWPAASTRAVAA